MRASERLWLNATRDKCVPETSTEAAFLWAATGDEIPDEAAERFGLVDGAPPAKKSRAKAEDKAEGKAGDKDGDAPPAKPKGGLRIDKLKKDK